ncbi:MAG: 5'/3'-nucleotidase SurE [Holosporaceae bacterium]|jgi:5'-nucleotidase|nr:5'/3'-nucleotidase SurE [Holosporaceae bacterium]
MISKAALSGLRILIVNDDGVNAAGIKALERVANSITPDVWVVAPELEQSGKSFSVTFNSILRVNEISPRKFSVSGTPADCVFIALEHILGDKKPDLILSGINHGENVADFIGMSGTVGAALAAAAQGIKALAVSQHRDQNGQTPAKFALADHFLPAIIKKLMSFSWPDRVCMNINLPCVPFGEVKGIKIAEQGQLNVAYQIMERKDPDGRTYYWIHPDYKALGKENDKNANSDIVLVEKENYVTITPLKGRNDFLECSSELEELFASNV